MVHSHETQRNLEQVCQQFYADLYKEQFSSKIDQVVKENVLKPFPQKFFAIMNEKLVAPITQEELKAWLHASPLALMVCESNVSHIFGTYLVKITRR